MNVVEGDRRSCEDVREVERETRSREHFGCKMISIHALFPSIETHKTIKARARAIGTIPMLIAFNLGSSLPINMFAFA